jgi:hypothetical protein
LCILEEASKLLTELFIQCDGATTLTDDEDTSIFLDECLDGSLLLKERPVDLIGCEGMIWHISRYESSTNVMKHMEQLAPTTAYKEMKKVHNKAIDVCQKNRVQPPEGASMLRRFNESSQVIESLDGGCIREA